MNIVLMKGKKGQKLVDMPNDECIKGKFVNLCLSCLSLYAISVSIFNFLASLCERHLRSI